MARGGWRGSTSGHGMIGNVWVTKWLDDGSTRAGRGRRGPASGYRSEMMMATI